MIHVAGGTYLEHCREPQWFELFGSGLRAALALAHLRTRVRLSTVVGEEHSLLLRTKAGRIDVLAQEIPSTIAFEYLHPLSQPAILPVGLVRALTRNPARLEVRAKRVIRFGLIEGTAIVNARMAVYDPQSPDDPQPFAANGSVAERLAVIANRTEAKGLTGIDDPEKACLALSNMGEVGIVKCGAFGCWVGYRGRATRIPAMRTERVFPIGSGDVFTALFGHGWMELGLSPVKAATLASRGAAHYVETRQFPSAKALAQDKRVALKPLKPSMHKKVYLASPFFNLPQRWLMEEFLFVLQQAGLNVFAPLHDVGRGSAEEVYSADIEGLKRCGVVLACLDGLDPGTIYEIGYAHRHGLPVIAFVSAERDEDLKMPIGGGCFKADDFATAFYLTAWAATCV